MSEINWAPPPTTTTRQKTTSHGPAVRHQTPSAPGFRRPSTSTTSIGFLHVRPDRISNVQTFATLSRAKKLNVADFVVKRTVHTPERSLLWPPHSHTRSVVYAALALCSCSRRAGTNCRPTADRCTTNKTVIKRAATARERRCNHPQCGQPPVEPPATAIFGIFRVCPNNTNTNIVIQRSAG